ncbi:MAG: prepilin-type N-terminal cleavage/methylation domain-containing protein [Phycisphaerae bacterium]|nr:prepilin-type N-terminal cleavage/methylation domain-containing protein [Phycisphaerae bacterium]
MPEVEGPSETVKEVWTVKRSKAFTLIELLVVIAIIALLISILLPSLSRARELSKRTVCAANLKGLGQSMYIYAQDDPGTFPAIAQVWNANNGAMQNFLPNNRINEPSTTGTPSVSVDLWALLRANNSTPKQFNCPSTTDIPDPAQDTTAYFDFLSENPASGASQYLSYGYHYQHDPNRRIVGTSSEPTFPIMADGNPYIKGGITGVAPLTDRREAGRGNSKNHTNREGENILFQDSHVSFEKGPDVGLSGRISPGLTVSRGRDNCYTYVAAGATQPVDAGTAIPTATIANPGSNSDAVIVP